MKSSRKSLRKRSKRKRDNDHPHDNEHSKDIRAPSNLPHRRKKQIRKQDGINAPTWEESKQEVPKVIFVVAGSAGGRPPKAIKSLLEGLGMTIYVPNSGKWKSYKTEGQNREFLLEGIKEAMKIAKKEKEAHNIVIASSSFGCRVAASLWVADKAEGVVPKIVMRKLICFGYPLFRPKPGQDRIRVLKDLPENLQVLMVSGTRDDFLHRDYQCLPRGIKAIEEIQSQSKAQIQICSTNGKHNPLDGAKKDEKARVRSTVLNFIRNAAS